MIEQFENYVSDFKESILLRCAHGLKSLGFPSMMINGLISNDIPWIHESQKLSWDCGIACIKMARNQCRLYNQHIPELDFTDYTSPLWTIQIYYELRKLGIHNVEYYTLHASANLEIYRNYEWYQNQCNDYQKASEVFRQCDEYGWKIKEQKLSIEQFLQIISKGSTAILLVDSILLNNSSYFPSPVVFQKDSMTNGKIDYDMTNYAGHYIYALRWHYKNAIIHDTVLSPANIIVEYLDPARSGSFYIF
jgi:hypothetical protein